MCSNSLALYPVQDMCPINSTFNCSLFALCRVVVLDSVLVWLRWRTCSSAARPRGAGARLLSFGRKFITTSQRGLRPDPCQGSLSLGFLVLGFTVQCFTLIKLGVLNGSLCLISSKAPRMGCLLYFQTPQGICFCQERRLTTKVFASLRKDSSTSCKASRRKNIQHAQTPVDDEGKQEGPRVSSESACCSYS